MDSSSRKALLQLFEGTFEWKRRHLIQEEATTPWRESHLSAVYGYILKLGINSDSRVLNCAKNMGIGEHWYPKSFSWEMVAYFLQELQEFFVVPQLYDEEDAAKKIELLAAFINFLVQLLYYKTDLINSFEDQIDILKKELRFLVTVLGDTSLLGAELEHVQNLLAEFEAVANEAGSLVYSFIFAMDRACITGRIVKDLGALLKHIDLLGDNITKFLIELPFISKRANIAPNTAAVDSLFIVGSLLCDLEDLLNRKDDRVVDVKGQIKILCQGLTLCQSLLKDIKLPPHSDIEELKETVVRIRDVAYEAEYLINSFLVGDAHLWYLTIRLPDIIHKIKLVGTQLQEIKKKYDIGAFRVAKDFSAQLSLQPKTNSEAEDIIVGLEDKAIDILNQLVGGAEHLQIISIFGMPGLGKTTLAKKLFNHPSVNYHFDKQLLCVVSQTYQSKNLLIDILISLGSELDKITILNVEEESLAEHIYKCLKGRRYLIVMDDIWNSNVWDDLRRYFPDDGNGSRILFTSRNKDVAPPDGIIYALPSLSNDECWELLEKKVFQNKPCPPKLLGVGKKIAADCNGLPLAVVVIAGILSTIGKEESTWRNVGKSLGTYIFSDQNNSVMQILKLSYQYLPDHLKPCFLYLGVFPEDKEIPVRRLKCLWISEGFIYKEDKRSPEDVAEEYLMELIDKSLVIAAKRRSDGGVKACVVHDLLRDLCLRIAEEENFLKLIDTNYSIRMKHQRLSNHMNRRSEVAPQFLLPLCLHLRSYFCSLPDSSLYLLNMKLLRVLDVPNNSLSIDDRIGLLVHLRYLAVKFMSLASIGSLLNLEFLVVTRTEHVVTPLPTVIQRMMKLRYLRLHFLARFAEDCNCSLTNNLEFISSIYIQTLQDVEILKCSPHLRKLKCMCRPLLDEQGVYRCPDLRFLTQLQSLNMSGNFGSAEINFPSNIRKLTLHGLCLPWEKMSIIGGLPNLQVLKLASGAFVGERWDTAEGEFQQLRFLKLNNLDIAQWNAASGEHFPMLQRLVLCSCFKLQEIPCEIGEAVTLQLIEVEWCPESVAKSAMQIQQEQQEMGNEELRVIIINYI